MNLSDFINRALAYFDKTESVIVTTPEQAAKVCELENKLALIVQARDDLIVKVGALEKQLGEMQKAHTEKEGELATANNRPGTEVLVTKIRQAMEVNAFDQLKVAAEATGWYWFHLFEALRAAAYPTELFLLNPRLTANFKKSYVDMDKSDDLDAFVIADRLRWGRDVEHPFQYDEKLLALRFLTSYRYRVVHQLAGEKAYCLSILYLKASEYANADKPPFSNLFGAASRAVIQEFASMEEVAALPFDELVKWLDQRGKRHFADPQETARRLQAVARDSYPLALALQSPVNLVLNLSLKNISQLESLQKRLVQRHRRTNGNHSQHPHFHPRHWPGLRRRYHCRNRRHRTLPLRRSQGRPVRHAKKVTISGRLDPDQAEIQIVDDGTGFRMTGAEGLASLIAQKHFGLAGMTERASLIGATVQIQTAPGKVTRIKAVWKAKPTGALPEITS